MAEELDRLDLYYEQIRKAIKRYTEIAEFQEYFNNSIKVGDNSYYHKNIQETKTFDEEWVRTLEAFFPSIEEIITHPRSTIQYVEEIVAVEKAKKINSASVRHLASHTQNIREVRNGEVVPKKILTTFAEEDFGTYENRFIMTLINRLFTFVNNRSVIIRENVESYQKEHANYQSNFHIKDTNVTIDVDVVIKKDLDDKSINAFNYQLLKRVEYLLQLITSYRNSQFMKLMAKQRKVNPPIMKTNVILKNPDFKAAYMLWLFLDKYDSLGYDVEVKERRVKLAPGFDNQVSELSLLAYAMIQESARKRAEKFGEEIDEELPTVVKKSTKIAKTHPADLIVKPDAIKLADNTINEYYLEQNKKVITKKVSEDVEKGMTNEAALKKAIKESINITNALFNSIFYIEESTDYFQRIVTETTPKQLYDDAKYKLKYAKIIRETKEADYIKSIKLERNLNKQMEKAATTLARQQAADAKSVQIEKVQKKMEKDAKLYKRQKAKNMQMIDKLDGKLVLTSNNKTILKDEQDQLQERIKVIRNETMTSRKAKLKEELAIMEKDHKAKMAKLYAEEEQKVKDANERYNKRKLALKEKEKAEIIKIKAKEEEKARLEKEKLKAKQQAEQQKVKERTQKKVNEINNKPLKEEPIKIENSENKE